MDFETFQNISCSKKLIANNCDQHVHNKMEEIDNSNSLNNCQINTSTSCTLTKDEDSLSYKENTCEGFNGFREKYCHIKLNSILKLKYSTKQLLDLLEEIQTKVHTNNLSNENTRLNSIKSGLQYNDECIITDEFVTGALKELKTNAHKFDSVTIKNEDDDCSVYKRLTRKCHCLNHPDYNDFVIHFNEDSKYTTSNLGEIIKNLRIMKKFLYMGGINTRNALMFLSEGLMDSQHSEKVDIILGCAHADICNIFEDYSVVVICISWPCKYRYYGNYVTQNLAAGFLYKLAEIEEGRRYLNYTSKVTNDIKKILRKKSSYLEIDIIDSLNATLNLLKPSFAKDLVVTYFSKSVYEGIGKKTIKDLLYYRQFMTIDEILMHLDLMNKYSSFEIGKSELITQLPTLLTVFKILLIEYDNSELNIIITNILNNIVSKNVTKVHRPETSKCWTIADTITEPVPMKNEVCQIPLKKNVKKINKPKLTLGICHDKHHQLSKKRDFSKSVIVVPMEK